MDKSQHTQKYQQLLERLRAARLAAGLTQLDVAEKLETYASFISKIESGERRLDVVELATLCELYDCRLGRLLKSVGLD